MPVNQTALDLREGMLLGDGLDAMDTCPQMAPAHGYDHNYVLRKGSAKGFHKLAMLHNPYTAQPE